MDIFLNSIFDYHYNKDLLEGFPLETKFKNKVSEGNFYEKNSQNLLNYVICDHELFLFDKNIPYKKINLSWTKIYYYFESNKYCIKFARKFEFFNIYFLEWEFYNNFLEIIGKLTIQTDFHKKYKVDKLIGKGGSARVYLITNIETDKKYAVKALPKMNLFNEKFGIIGIMNEIEIMRTCKHKNIIELIEVHETENSLYIITELIEGGEILISDKLLDFTEIIHIFKNILLGLQYLNSINIMHRDLKLENILLTKKDEFLNSEIKIIDLGLGTKIDLDKFIFKKCGTPGYIAPEIIKGEKYNEKVDIFSLGIILIILLTGKRVFSGKNFKEIYEKNKKGDIDFSIIKNIPKSLNELIIKMIEKNPKDRISLNNVLNHKFFKEYEEKNNKVLNNDDSKYINLKVNLKINSKNLKPKKNTKNSLIYRKENWNGKTDTIIESKNSIGSNRSINIKKNKTQRKSLNSKFNNNNNNINNNKRKESIYKHINKNEKNCNQSKFKK